MNKYTFIARFGGQADCEGGCVCTICRFALREWVEHSESFILPYKVLDITKVS